MGLYNVSYDLQAHKDYARVHDGIKRVCPNWSKPLESTWVVEWNGTGAQLRDAVGAYFDSDDKLLVMAIVGTSLAWRNLTKPVSDWIHSVVKRVA